MMNGYEKLALAIVEQAILDYKQAVKCLETETDRKEICKHEHTIFEVERFFKSKWCDVLTDYKGKYYLKLLQIETKRIEGNGDDVLS